MLNNINMHDLNLNQKSVIPEPIFKKSEKLKLIF